MQLSRSIRRQFANVFPSLVDVSRGTGSKGGHDDEEEGNAKEEEERRKKGERK